ncbi:MAG: GNAT family N-acetyltransferase [Bacteroidetes bacterium]|nr:MAG: GNAT family N-acetyltransferase [Bacteroidota bacterium]
MTINEIENLEFDYLEIKDYEELFLAMQKAYPDIENPLWEKDKIKKLKKVFNEGQVVIKVNGEIVACALSIIVDYDKYSDNHNFKKITKNYTFDSHTEDGDVLYGIDMFVVPEYRELRLGRRMYDYLKELCEKYNLRGIVAGGRISGYQKYQESVTPKGYIEQVKRKEIDDLILNFHIANDFYPSRILKAYLEGEDARNEYTVLLKWDNIYFEKPTEQVETTKSEVRLGLIQWQMRPYHDLDEVMQQAEFFIDAVSEYRSDFALFPELFNAPLMAKFNHMSEHEAIRQLADYTEEITRRFSELAIAYNINIISGSMPELRDNALYNVGYLCRRDGSLERYEKLHVTPDEARVWGLQGGSQLKTFDTDCGKIGILICYDSEFPELSRLLADEGMDILFVPYLTDTQNGFSRVRHCAQARAIENECYVAIAGSVGNLPNVRNMSIQYAQSMVLTPCDFAFPSNGVKAETTPNTEMILIVDVEIDSLRELHEFGSVRNLKDRRKDMFSLKKVITKN